jgi:hypothetical protein
VAIGINPSLLVAATDLRVVQLIRRAIRNADHVTHQLQAGPPGPDPTPHFKSHPTPHIEPRLSITPTPRIEPRLVYRPHKIEPPNIASPSTIPVDSAKIKESPIQPPWRALPWAQPAQPAPKLKVVIRRPDVPVKGSVFDVFV